MLNIAVLTYHGGAFFELGCALELFALPRPEIADWYRCEAVTFSTKPATLLGGISLQARQVNNLNKYSMLVIPGWHSQHSSIDPTLAKAIRKFHAAGKRIVSFCSGAFLLAELGILANREATTHWRYADLFKARFPEVNFVNDVLYVYDGQLGCSAGSAAALDLGIEIIRQDYGYQIANQVARQLVLASHRKGGQRQFVETPVLHSPGNFSASLDWAASNLHERISIDQLASKASMSRRSFDRKFRASFKLSPNAWLTEQRLSLARQLLETQDSSMEKIAMQAGFANAGSMRHHFRKTLGIAPGQYQEQFGTSK